MTKKLVQTRICDKCVAPTDAAVTERLSHNGEAFSLDLCQRHSDQLADLVHSWTKGLTPVGRATVFEARRVLTGPTVVDLEPLTIQPTPAEEPEPYPAPTPLVSRRPAPEYPPTADRWEITSHCKERMDERGFSLAEVLTAAERPHHTVPSKTHPSCMVHVLKNCTVVVNPFTEEIVTVYPTAVSEPLRVGAR